VQGARTTVFRRCLYEVFASFGECARWDGLVERVTRYADDERRCVQEVWVTVAWQWLHMQPRAAHPMHEAGGPPHTLTFHVDSSSLCIMNNMMRVFVCALLPHYASFSGAGGVCTAQG
jgi:hypothetical protein